MTKRKNQQPPMVITVRAESGIDYEYHVTTIEGQAEVAALVERLRQRRAETDQQLISVDNIIRELNALKEMRANAVI